MSSLKACPHCGVSWEQDETIYETFINQGYNPDEAYRIANEFYGHTKESPRHFGKNVIGVEYPGKYDGVWEWEYQMCYHTTERWPNVTE